MPLTIKVGTFKERTGQHLGHSDWFEINQNIINAFADLTDDHGWPHVDVDRSNASPIGGTIAHGFFTLSLFMHFWNQLVVVEEKSVLLNYGIDRLRFTAPVPAGGKVRLGLEVGSVKPFEDGELVTYKATFDLAGSDRPVCVADILFRYYREGQFPTHVSVRPTAS